MPGYDIGGGGGPHTHPESEVTSLVTDLSGKSATGHTHAHAATTGQTATDHHTNANDPSSGEKAALAGTSGTPGSGNKFVTDGDARNANARTPSAHAASHAGGGSDPVSAGGYPLDQYALNGTYGDHYTQSSITGLWTRRGYTSGAETYQVGPLGTYVRISQSGRAAGDGYLQPSTVDGTYACKLIYRNFGNNYPAFGLCMVDSAGTGVWLAPYNNPAGFLLGAVTTYSTWGNAFHLTGGGGDGNPVFGGTPGIFEEVPIWLYLRKSGSSVFAAHSFDGEIWSAESSALTWAGTMNRVGFMNGPLGSIDGNPNTAFVDRDWFNKIA